MNRSIKIVLYIVLLAAALVLSLKFYAAYRAVMQQAAVEKIERIDDADEIVPSRRETNALPATNVIAATNVAAVTNVATATDLPAATNTGAATNLAVSPADRRPSLPARQSEAPKPVSLATMMTYGAILFVVVVCLSVLAAHDLSVLVAGRFNAFLLSENGVETKDPEYERAEQLWADGNPLEAIQVMRDYLKRHPRKQYVAIRIAEIYEKDLGNYLAAALEYEEVLKHRLLPEQWGWAAIHLANLYSGKLNQTDKAVAWLRRIISEHGSTAAAAKARTRLAQIEEGNPKEPGEEADLEPPPPASNLPRGFRPKTSR